MSKVFIDTDLYKQSLRGVDVKLRLAHHWLWENCDRAGVWKMDLDLFKFECGYKLELESLLKACPWIKRLPNGSLFLPDYVRVNYGTLKPDYNPHKPVFRSFVLNGIDPLTLESEPLGELIQPFSNPSVRVVEEEEEEDIDEVVSNSEKKERATHEVMIWPTFDDWWEAYSKKKGRTVAEPKWNRLNQATKEAIMAHTPIYVTSTPDVTYRKDPSTYLNQKSWTDEYVPQPKPLRNDQQAIQDGYARNLAILEAEERAAGGDMGEHDDGQRQLQ